MNHLVRFVFAFCVATLYGCDSSTGSSPSERHLVSMDTIEGRIFIDNVGSGAWREGEEWTFEEDWRVGRAAGEDWELFGGLTSVLLGPSGEAFIIDFQAQRIVVFNREGDFVRYMGGPGQGPGEFDGPLALGWDPRGRLWIPDGWNRRYSIFDSEGTFMNSFPRPLGVAGFRQRLTYHEAGFFLDQTSFVGPDDRRGLALVRVDTAGLVIDTLPPLEYPRVSATRPPPGALSELGDFVPGLRWNVTSDGFIWSARSDQFRLIQRSLDGDTLRIVETDHRDPRLDDEEDRKIEAELGLNGLSRSDFSLGRQVVQNIHVMDDGHLLVQVEEEVGEDGGLFDVIDPDGRLLGSMRIDPAPRRLTIPALQGDTLILISRGDHDVSIVVRGTLKRPVVDGPRFE